MGSTSQKWAEWFLLTGLLPDQVHLDKTWQSARTKLDLGWFCTILSGMSLEERDQVWKSETGSGPAAFCHNRAQRFLYTGLLPDRIHFGQNPESISQNRIGSWLVLHNMIRAFFGRMAPYQMWEVRSSIIIWSSLILAADCHDLQ